MSNGSKKLWEAVHVLVTSDRTIQERLAGAAISLIQLIGPDPTWSEAHGAELQALRQELTSVEASGSEGRIQATTRTLSSEQASKLAERILGLYTAVKGGI